jgi:hypothetical protein
MSSDGEIEPWTQILLPGVVACMIESGLPREHIASEIRELAKRIESGDPISPVKSEDLGLLRSVSGIVHDWCRDPDCTSPYTGQPQPLRLDSGKVTLRELIQRHLPHTTAPAVINFMARNGVLLAQDDGSYALKRPANVVMIDSSTNLAIQRLTNAVMQQLRAAIQNLQVPDVAKNLERAANVRHLPVRLLPEFRAWTKTQGQNFLDIIDTWLTNRNAPDGTEPTVAAGVQVYAYTNSPDSPATSRSRKGTTEGD